MCSGCCTEKLCFFLFMNFLTSELLMRGFVTEKLPASFTYKHTYSHTEDQQGLYGSLSKCIIRLSSVCRSVYVCTGRGVNWENQASVCLLGTDVCANHCRHFPSLPIAAQVIGSPTLRADGVLLRHRESVCLHHCVSVNRVALVLVGGRCVWLVSQNATERGDDYPQ